MTLCMLEAIRDHWLETGVKVGMKPAGGIRTSKQALHYLVLVKETLGADWLDAGPLPLRRLQPPQRPPDAAEEREDGPLPDRGRFHQGLRGED